MQAFRKDIIIAMGEYIYPMLFDNICWAYNGEISQQILRYLIPYNIVQFNKLVIENNSSLPYPRAYDVKFISSYLKKLGLHSLVPCFYFKHNINIFAKISIILLNSFIELLYWIPFPIKEFDVAKRAEYVKQCLQKMETLDIPESKKAEDCINT